MILGWGLANTLDAQVSLEVVQQTVATYGCPEIINSDQGSQFTCKEYVEYLKRKEIKISMDGKGRALDNIFIERFCGRRAGVPLNTDTFICSLIKMVSRCTKVLPSGWTSTTTDHTKE